MRRRWKILEEEEAFAQGAPSGEAGVVPPTFVRACVLREGTQFPWRLKDLCLKAKASTPCQVSSLIIYESAQHPVQTTSPGASPQAQL